MIRNRRDLVQGFWCYNMDGLGALAMLILKEPVTISCFISAGQQAIPSQLRKFLARQYTWNVVVPQDNWAAQLPKHCAAHS